MVSMSLILLPLSKRSHTMTDASAIHHRSNRSDSQLNDLGGIEDDPIVRLKYRLCVPLWWWRNSRLRRVVGEIYRIPLRILASLRVPFPYRIPINTPDLSDYGKDAFCLESTYLHSCSENIQNLRNKNHWASYQDLEMVTEAHRLGAEWAIRNLSNESKRKVP